MDKKVFLLVFTLLALISACMKPEYFLGTIIQPAAKGLVFEDSSIYIAFALRRDEIRFVLQNKASESAVIKWNDTVYVSPVGITYATSHKGMKTAGRNNSLVDGIIPPGAVISDTIIPNEYVHGTAQGAGDILSERSVGSIIGVFMPIETDGKRTDYYFRIRVDSVGIDVSGLRLEIPGDRGIDKYNGKEQTSPRIAESPKAPETPRVNLPEPIYHVLVLDRRRSRLNADIAGAEGISVLNKYRHGANGYLIAVYTARAGGAAFPVLPAGSKVLVNYVSTNRAAVINYLNSAQFRKYVSSRTIINQMQRGL
ncbi:MAG: hypothetical protein LBC99_09985 [Spirochaetota bacterium]|nr:hypothetical protein [Spirochaetota bacterium]